MVLLKLTGMVAALGLCSGLVATTAIGHSPVNASELMTQDKAKKPVSVKGTAIGADGQPASKILIEVKELVIKSADGSSGGDTPGVMLANQPRGGGNLKTLGKGVTGEDGKFEIKGVRPTGEYVNIYFGEKTKSDWLIHNAKIVDGKDLEMGEVKLRRKIGKGE